MKRSDLVTYLDEYLHIAEIEDYGPQGLQVEAGNDQIERVALAVDSAPPVIEEAARWQANMLLVHHGILWGTLQPIAGALGRRVRLLLEHGINLYSAHLPLDAHPEVGNNAVLARLLDVAVEGWWCLQKGTPIGVFGSLAQELKLKAFASRVDGALNTSARIQANGPERVKRVAIISGFGADEVEGAKTIGADTFLTGETSHAHYWAASDYGLNVVFAGHYATETVGVQELGRHLTEKFGLQTRFLDFPTGL